MKYFGRIPRFLTAATLFFSLSFNLSAQAGGGSAGKDPAAEALGWMVEETGALLVKELGREDEVVLELGEILYDGGPVLLGEYLAASLPIRLAARSGHDIRIADRPGATGYRLSGRLFSVAADLQLFLSLTDNGGTVVGGKELRLPGSEGMRAMLEPAVSAVHGGDRYEPDAQERPVDVVPGEELSGRSINPAGDIDWYRFTNEGDEAAVLTVGTAGGLDTYIEVYRESDPFSPIAENDDAVDQNARLSLGIEPGESLIAAVRGYESGERGEYLLTSRLELMPDDPSEPDNRLEEAGELRPGDGALIRRIFPSGDVDWYRVRIPASASPEGLYLDILSTGELDTYMEFFDETGEYLVEDDDGSGNSNARIYYGPVSPGETYYLALRQYDDGAVGDYGIEASLSRPRLDQYEPDNSWEEARELRFREGSNGGVVEQLRTFSTPVDPDWIRFSLDSPRTLIAATLGDADTLLRLYDADGELIEESDDDGEEYNGRIRRFLAAGNYRLEITQYVEDAQMGAEYRLRVEAGQ